MTLLQISVTRDRALIATDATCYASDQGAPGADVYRWPDGEPVHVTKLHAMPHIRAVLTGRGTSTVRQFAADQITHARDFDHAVELLNLALPKLPTLPGTYRGKPLQHSVYLVGWSGGAMALGTWESPGYVGRVQRCKEGGRFQVLGPATKRPEWLSDPKQVEARQADLAAYLDAERETDALCLDTAAAYARLAVEHARQDDPAAPYGGRLLVAELTRDSYRMIDAGDLGLPPRRPGAADLITALQPGLATACIQPGAATEVVTDRSSSLSYSFVSSTGGFEYRVQRLLQISWTNTMGANVDVELSGEIGGTLSSGPGSVWLGIDSQASAALTSNIFSSLASGSLHTDASTEFRRYTLSDTLTVSPGGTIYLALTVYIFSAVGTTTAYAGDGRIRITAIKR